MDRKIINTTKHPITFKNSDGQKYTVEPYGLTIRGYMDSEIVNRCADGTELVYFDYKPTQVGLDRLEEIHERYPEAIVVGSVVAAQAYPGLVHGLVPCNGCEDLPPSERVYRDDRFSTFRK